MNADRRRLIKNTKTGSSSESRINLAEPVLTKAEQSELDRVWKAEIRRRMHDFKTGKAKEVPADVALRNAYRALEEAERTRRKS
jgi:transcription initiation factor TFIID subunit TAF12